MLVESWFLRSLLRRDSRLRPEFLVIFHNDLLRTILWRLRALSRWCAQGGEYRRISLQSGSARQHVTRGR